MKHQNSSSKLQRNPNLQESKAAGNATERLRADRERSSPRSRQERRGALELNQRCLCGRTRCEPRTARGPLFARLQVLWWHPNAPGFRGWARSANWKMWRWKGRARRSETRRLEALRYGRLETSGTLVG